MTRRRYASSSPFEPIVGYSRALRVGGLVFVSGTTATDAKGEIVGKGDAYVQTRQALENAEAALRALGARLSDVVRTRLYVVNLADWRSVARAHAERLGSTRPVSTMVEVKRLIDPDMLVEIEVDAVVESRLGSDARSRRSSPSRRAAPPGPRGPLGHRVRRGRPDTPRA